jgi:hypothetical protein
MVGACDEASKSCGAKPGHEGAPCSTGVPCLDSGSCHDGACVKGQPSQLGAPCDDADACTLADTCQANGGCDGAPIVACVDGDGCCPAACTPATDSDCKTIKVGVMSGAAFYDDSARAYLAAMPLVAAADTIGACTLAALQQYDVVIVWGNMSCYSPSIFDAYVTGGGGLVGTPWVFNNNAADPIHSLPLSGAVPGAMPFHPSDPLNLTVTHPNDILLQGVNFGIGDPVGFEERAFKLDLGATTSATWNTMDNQQNVHAVAKGHHGQGRAVYLNFHYITSGTGLAIQHGWGKQLLYNAVLWSGKVM